MAIVTRQEFADLCGDDVKSITVNITRKKIILDDDTGKNIDTKHPLNATFIKKRKAWNNAKKESQALIKSIPVNPRKGKSDEEDPEDELPDPIDERLLKTMFGAGRSLGSDSLEKR
jgi:hypothetical protein